jgi:magnesium-transporting ATPase (P-type)
MGNVSNIIVTSKYTPINFLPFNLFKQLRRPSNAYFLVVLALQCIPSISRSTIFGLPAMLPSLTLVVAISMFKDAVEDYKRHQADHEENNRRCKVLDNRKWRDVLSHMLCVGDMIRIQVPKSSLYGPYIVPI